MASATDRRVALAHEWDELVARVRRLGPRFASFLAPPRAQDLASAVGDGTAVLINVARECHALLVTASGVTAVPLPGLSATEIAERAEKHLTALRRTDLAAQQVHHTQERARVRKVPATYQAHHAAKLEMAEAQAELDRTLLPQLAWLWDTVAEPVLRAIGSPTTAGAEARHRIWWCPTGLLSFLPLHAAGHHDRSGHTVLDRAVSSCVPTLRALARAAHSPEPEPAKTDKLLVVAVQEADGMSPLPQVAEELRLLEDMFGPDRLTVLEGPDATREAVLGQLPKHRWAHFSCHGRQDPLAPSTGGLLLTDGILGIKELGARSYNGDFAFLSACMTAAGGLSLSDEAITVGAALHYSGFRHVVAALWSIDADTATALTGDVFGSLMRGGRFRPQASAAAVTEAVIRLRDDNPAHPSRWAAFTHIGP
ncbi:CHAT domain-containing protein [Streptomyces sp. NPDC021969]|uniref:CHAT domain-containing protein n=1 Tax=unclassified Streptomyces TaxID=2593676 RepID=UPI003404DC42